MTTPGTDTPPERGSEIYVSITGLRLKGWIHNPRFWWHAVRSMQQARGAAGNLCAETRLIEGVHHTLTAWTDRRAMRAYLVAGAHKQAMFAFGSMATGSVVGFEAQSLPSWAEARRIWEEQGREVQGWQPRPREG